MIFGNNSIFCFFLLLGLLFFFFIQDEKKRRSLLSLWAIPSALEGLTGLISAPKRKAQKAIELICFGLILMSLAHPLFQREREAVMRKGIDVVIAVDVSLSMLAEDYAPNRLQKAKQELISLLKTVRGHRVGLVAFAGHAAVLCPLTTDTPTLQTYLDVLDTRLFDDQGTALSDALEKALGMFDKSFSHGKVIVLMTDGEGHQENPISMAKKAREAGVHIYCIGVGSLEGEPVPVLNESGQKTGYKTDAKGEVVLTKLNEDVLTQIAEETNGQYFKASLNELELDVIFQKISKLEKGEFGQQNLVRYEDMFQIPLLGAFWGFLWSEMMGVRRGLLKNTVFKMLIPVFLRGIKILVCIVMIIAQWGFTKSKSMEEANKLYAKGKYEEAAEKYSALLKTRAESPEVSFNLGNVMYQKKNYADAQEYYRQAGNYSPELLSSAVEYSVGNCYFKKDQYEKALTHYKKAVQLDPGDMDAKYNYEITLQKIKQEKQKQEEQKKQKEKNDKEQQKEKQPQKSSQQKEKDQNQPSPDKDKKNKQDQKQSAVENSSKDDKEQPQDASNHKNQQNKSEDLKSNQEKQKEKNEEEDKTSKSKKEKADQEKKNNTSLSEKKGGGVQDSLAQAHPQDSKAGKKGSEMSRQEALELLEVGHNDKKDLLYNLLRSQQHQNSSKEGKDW